MTGVDRKYQAPNKLLHDLKLQTGKKRNPIPTQLSYGSYKKWSRLSRIIILKRTFTLFKSVKAK